MWVKKAVLTMTNGHRQMTVTICSSLEDAVPLAHPHQTEQTSTTVVTISLPITLVTLLGVICHVGIEPTGARPCAPPMKRMTRSTNAFPVG